jgi:hypothetical protein
MKRINKPLTEKRVREIVREEILKFEMEKISRHAKIDALAKQQNSKPSIT